MVGSYGGIGGGAAGEGRYTKGTCKAEVKMDLKDLDIIFFNLHNLHMELCHTCLLNHLPPHIVELRYRRPRHPRPAPQRHVLRIPALVPVRQSIPYTCRVSMTNL